MEAGVGWAKESFVKVLGQDNRLDEQGRIIVIGAEGDEKKILKMRLEKE